MVLLSFQFQSRRVTQFLQEHNIISHLQTLQNDIFPNKIKILSFSLKYFVAYLAFKFKEGECMTN